MSELVAFMIAPLVCWIALFIYLWWLHARVSRLLR